MTEKTNLKGSTTVRLTCFLEVSHIVILPSMVSVSYTYLHDRPSEINLSKSHITTFIFISAFPFQIYVRFCVNHFI